MRKHVLSCLTVMVCAAWALASQAQKPDAARPLPPAQERLRAPQPGQVRGADEQDKVVVRRVFDDLFNSGRYELIDQIYTRDCRVHHGNKHSRLEETVAEGKGWRQAAPDLHLSVDQIGTRGSLVIVSWTARGTHSGEGNGLRPTGKRVLIHGSSEFRVVKGRIAEVWNHYDRNELFRQIGVNPRLGRLLDQAQELWSSFSRMLGDDHPAPG